MTGILISNLNPLNSARLNSQAAEHGRSIEEEAKALLEEKLGEIEARKPTNVSLWDAVRSCVDPIGGIDDLQLPSRKSIRPPFEFEK